MPTIDRALRQLAPFASLALIVLIWHQISAMAVVPRTLLPSPAQAAVSLYRLIVSGEIWSPFFDTLTGALAGYVTGSLLAIVTAAWLANSKWAERFLMMYVSAFQAIPKVALAPLIFIWCGFGLLSASVLVAMSCFYPVFANAFVGFRAADPNLIAMYRVFSANTLRIFLSVQLPAAASLIFVGLELGIVFSLIAEIVMEFISGRPGLGNLIQESSSTLEAARAYGALAVLVVLGISASAVVRLIRRYVVFWDRRTHGTDMRRGGTA